LWYFSCMVLVVEIMGCLGRLLSLRGFHVWLLDLILVFLHAVEFVWLGFCQIREFSYWHLDDLNLLHVPCVIEGHFYALHARSNKTKPLQTTKQFCWEIKLVLCPYSISMSLLLLEKWKKGGWVGWGVTLLTWKNCCFQILM
jgi:hypothetical protein